MTGKDEKDKIVEATQQTDTHTDVYHETEYVIPDSGVAIPTEAAVEDAKDWVDEENRK